VNNSAIFHTIEQVQISSGNFFQQTPIVKRFKTDIDTQILQQKEKWIKTIPLIVLFLFAFGCIYILILDMTEKLETFTSAYVILLFISVLELLYFLALKGNTWFCSPGKVGWLWTIINFILYAGIIIAQYKVFDILTHRITQRGIYSSYNIGIISAAVGIIMLLLYSYHFEQYEILRVTALIILIGGQAMQFIVNVVHYGLTYGPAVSIIYIICFSALLLVIAYFLKLLLIVYLGYCLLAAFGSLSKSSDSSTSDESDSATIRRYGTYDEKIN
jgi:hypothetical protein